MFESDFNFAAAGAAIGKAYVQRLQKAMEAFGDVQAREDSRQELSLLVSLADGLNDILHSLAHSDDDGSEGGGPEIPTA